MRSLRAIVAGVEYKYLVAAAFVFGLFMDILDTTIVNVALPVLGEEFNAGTAQLEWVVTGYLLSLAIWIPASGWIGDRFGTKRTFLFATAMFVVGSALCAAAWSIQSLAFFRVLQGVGGGMLTPVGTAMLYRAFTPAERARASAILSIPTMIAPMLGPVIGGFLVTYVELAMDLFDEPAGRASSRSPSRGWSCASTAFRRPVASIRWVLFFRVSGWRQSCTRCPKGHSSAGTHRLSLRQPSEASPASRS